jgi:hypothetical protein
VNHERLAVDWSKLDHAYGDATNIPSLLAAARGAPPRRGYDDEPWFTLWGSLYHQDSIYSASFAAVPALVDVARECADHVAMECLTLASSIELRRNQPRAPTVPPQVVEAYRAAIPLAIERVSDLREKKSLSPADSNRLEIIHAVFVGNFTRALELLGEDADVTPTPIA